MYLSKRLYIVISCIVFILTLGYVYTPLFYIGVLLLAVTMLILLVDITMLFSSRGIDAERHCAERFSNGDANGVSITVDNRFPFRLSLDVTDEIPVIFQDRNVSFHLTIHPKCSNIIKYNVTPVRRGVYSFGHIRVFARTSRIGFSVRQFVCGKPYDVKVYPSFVMLRQYEILAISNNLTEMGIKRIRRTGQQTEFEQIREYNRDDDYRRINWKASARRNMLMVNVYEDERSQRIFNVIDKGRVMQQTFRDMTLLDYAINASLVLSYVAIKKEDRAGLITFAQKQETYIEPSNRDSQMQNLMESLYSQQTNFSETDFSSLCTGMASHINRRCLMILYTNFANMTAMSRQLEYLQLLNRKHRVLVVFFEDTELKKYIGSKPKKIESLYQHVIAEKFVYEKRLIVKTLQEHGILSLLTTPERLSVDVINKYLEIKSRQLI
jgi:uncharacterized protein (DUF58 family)